MSTKGKTVKSLRTEITKTSISYYFEKFIKTKIAEGRAKRQLKSIVTIIDFSLSTYDLKKLTISFAKQLN